MVKEVIKALLLYEIVGGLMGVIIIILIITFKKD